MRQLPVMRKFPAAAAMFLSAVALTSAPSVFARDAEAMGSVKGTIVNSAGAPAVGCIIKIYSPPNLGGAIGGGGRGGAGKSAGLTPDVTLLQAKGTPVATVTTDKKGDFEVKTIKAGDFRYIAGNRNIGMAGGGFSVEAGKTASVQVKLNPPAPR